MNSERTLGGISGYAWVAGGAALVAILTHCLAIAAYPPYFAGAASPLRYEWQLGWPWPFAKISVDGQWKALSGLALGADIAVAGPGHRQRHRGGRLLATIAISALGWLLLSRALGVNVGVFLGWAALAVDYLAVPCAAWAIVIHFARAMESPRFSLRWLFIFITASCIVLAAVAWRLGQRRAPRGLKGEAVDRPSLVPPAVRD